MFILNDFFDSGIYIIIVVVAAIVVLIAVATLNGMSKPKRKSIKKRGLLTEGKKEHREKAKLLKEPEKEKKQEDKRKGDKRKEDKRRKEKQEDEIPIEVLTVTADEPAKSSDTETEVIDLPELPSADNLEEAEEETDEEAKTEDLMNIFEVDEVEDTYASELAANLFDVDLESLEKLGKEVQGVYSGKNKEESKEE